MNQTELDAEQDQIVTTVAQTLAHDIDNATASIRNAGRQLGDLTGCLFAIEWAEGTVGEDIAAHLNDAARSLRAAAALHRNASRASGV